MHPIIKNFIHTNDTFKKCLESARVTKPVDPILDNLKLLVNTEEIIWVNTKGAYEQALSYRSLINEALETQGDPLLFIFFLEIWFSICVQLDLTTDAHQTRLFLESLIDKNTPKELVAYYYRILGGYYKAFGEVQKGNHYSFQSIKILDPRSPRYLINIIYISNFTRYDLIEEDLKRALKGREKFYSGWLSIIQFMNCVDTGQCHKALKKLKEIPKNYFEKNKWEINVTVYESLLYKLIFTWGIENFTKEEKEKTAKLISFQPESLPYLSDYGLKFKIIDLLSAKDIEGANEVSKNLDPTITDITSWGNGTLIRLELCNRKAENAKMLLRNEINKGITTVWHDFFNFRICLLEGKEDEAQSYLIPFLKNIEQHHSFERMLFELRISLELDSSTLLKVLLPNMKLKTKMSVPERSASFDLIGGGLSGEEGRHEKSGLDRLLGHSNVSEKFKQDLKKIAKIDLPVLILGETGTGKDVTARCLHEISTLRDRPFVAVNCGAISDTLLESEIFGHVKGAFTGANADRKGVFEEANGGIVFLDEIGDINERLQISLLRVLENYEVKPLGSSRTKKITCRIIAATNKNLEQMVKDGSFRSDLFYRLSRLVLYCRPLREKPADIIALIEYFLNHGFEHNATLSPEAEEAFIEYPWPGNIRELKNSMERLRLLNGDKQFFDIDDLETKFRNRSESPEAFIVNIDEAIDENLPTKKIASTWEDDAELVINLSTSPLRRLDKIKKIFDKYEILTRKEIIEITKISQATISKDLKKLIAIEYIQKIEPSLSPRTHYFQKG